MSSCYNVALGCIMKIECLSCINFECRFPDGFLRFKCGRGNWSIDDIQAVFSSTPRLEEDLLIFKPFLSFGNASTKLILLGSTSVFGAAINL